MKVEIIDSESVVDTIWKEWEAFFRNTKSKNIFLTPEWSSSWMQNLRQNETIQIFIARHNNEILGIAPMFLKNNVLRPIGHPLNDYDGILARDPEVVDALLTAMIATNPRKVEFHQTQHDFHMDNKSGYQYIVSDSIPCPLLRFADFEAEELRKRLNKKLVRRQINHLKKIGSLQYVYSRKFNDIYFNAMVEQHKARWNPTNTPSMFNQIKYVNFYRQFLFSMMERNSASTAVLELDDAVMCILICFEAGGRAHVYTNTYDYSFTKYSPGLVLFKLNIDDNIQRGVQEYNFGRGQEDYKLKFTDNLDQTNKVVFYSLKRDYFKGYYIDKAKKLVHKMKTLLIRH